MINKIKTILNIVMKRILVLLLVLTPLIQFAQNMNVVSFNIRYNNPKDGEDAWPNRIEAVTGLLKFHDADIFGLQEVLFDQMGDIEKRLDAYEWIGVGRDDGHKKGEFAPIFFKKSKFSLIDKGWFWLSENCEKPGLGWDADCIRIVTWGKFQVKETGKLFYMFNTHFDHIGLEARQNSASLIINKVNEINGTNDIPTILTGDFNLTPDKKPISRLKEFFADARELSEEPPYGPWVTYNAFNPGDSSNRRIDYVFLNGSVKVYKYAVLTDRKGMSTPSDHYPVFVKMQIQ